MRALLLQVLYTIRSERLLMEELNYNLLFRWFVGLNMDDPVWHPTTFTKNRDRLLAGDVAAAFFDAVQAHARAAGLLSDEHFTVDGTQLEAWASLKSFRCRDAAPSAPPDDPGNPTVDFHGERRRNDTHQSTTDPEAMLHRRAKGRRRSWRIWATIIGMGSSPTSVRPTRRGPPNARRRHCAGGQRAAGQHGGADKGYDVASFVADVRVRDVTPHVAQKVRAIDGRTTRHAGYHVSQRKRKLVEQVFGWMKTVGGLRKLRHRGVPLVDWQLTFAATAYNLVRLRIWRRRVLDRRPRVSPAPSSGSAHTRARVGRSLDVLLKYCPAARWRERGRLRRRARRHARQRLRCSDSRRDRRLIESAAMLFGEGTAYGSAAVVLACTALAAALLELSPPLRNGGDRSE